MKTIPRLRQRPRIHLLQMGGVLFCAAALLTQPLLAGHIHEILELVGMSLIVACVAGRLWSTLYIGSKKNRQLVTTGPYSITRNPLYFFSTVGAIGVGLVFGSIAVAAILGLLTFRILMAMANKESERLRAIFGAEFEVYARHTPAFWPKLSLYRDTAEAAFSPVALRRTFMDVLPMLLVFPALETLEHLQSAGTIPILFRIF
jgi:protein-S-isoprenylcysteine O-methyltransferase Ste14